jgi:hypothetical protein
MTRIKGNVGGWRGTQASKRIEEMTEGQSLKRKVIEPKRNMKKTGSRTRDKKDAPPSEVRHGTQEDPEASRRDPPRFV